MKLDRNINDDGRGKYALINLRTNKVEWGNEPGNDFFVIKLKDRHAADALRAYADSIRPFDAEFAAEVDELVKISESYPDRKSPD